MVYGTISEYTFLTKFHSHKIPLAEITFSDNKFAENSVSQNVGSENSCLTKCILIKFVAEKVSEKMFSHKIHGILVTLCKRVRYYLKRYCFQLTWEV